MFEPAFMRLADRVGLVLADATTVGAALAEAFNWPPEIASVMASLGAALGLRLVQRPRRVSSESVTGWAYAVAAATPC